MGVLAKCPLMYHPIAYVIPKLGEGIPPLGGGQSKGWTFQKVVGCCFFFRPGMVAGVPLFRPVFRRGSTSGGFSR